MLQVMKLVAFPKNTAPKNMSLNQAQLAQISRELLNISICIYNPPVILKGTLRFLFH